MVWNDNHETMFCRLGLRLRNALLFWNGFLEKKALRGGYYDPPFSADCQNDIKIVLSLTLPRVFSSEFSRNFHGIFSGIFDGIIF